MNTVKHKVQLPIRLESSTFFFIHLVKRVVLWANVIKHFREPALKNTIDIDAMILLYFCCCHCPKYTIFIQCCASCAKTYFYHGNICFVFFFISRIFVYFSHLFWPNAILFGCAFCLDTKNTNKYTADSCPYKLV